MSGIRYGQSLGIGLIKRIVCSQAQEFSTNRCTLDAAIRYAIVVSFGLTLTECLRPAVF